MKNIIKTNYNKAYQWIEGNDIHFIGYLNEPYFHIPDNVELKNIFGNFANQIQFTEIVSRLNGVFSVIIQKEDSIYAACDSTRFFPLFYCIYKNVFSISDDFEFIIRHSGFKKINELARVEFLTAAFTCSHKTLIENIFQIRPAEILIVQNNLIQSQYYYWFSHRQKEVRENLHSQSFRELKSIINSCFEETLKPLLNYKIALPLSSGYDSRLIACKLKDLGFKNVVCFTYGRNNDEVNISKSVAEKLNFEWHFVEYTNQLINNFHLDPIFKEYYTYNSRGTSMFYLQEYPAVKYLVDKGIIDKDFISLPGHSGDLLRGALLVKNFPLDCKFDDLKDILLRQKFIHSKLKPKQYLLLSEELNDHLNELQYSSDLVTWSILEDWEMKERTAKYIFNSSQVFTVFGIRSVFPIWNKKLLEFFKYLPVKERIYSKLYYEVLDKEFFMPSGICFENDIQPVRKDIFLDIIKKKIRKYLPLFIKERLLLKNDWTFYERMTHFLEEDLKKEGVFLKSNGVSYLYRILNWYLYKLENGNK